MGGTQTTHETVAEIPANQQPLTPEHYALKEKLADLWTNAGEKLRGNHTYQSMLDVITTLEGEVAKAVDAFDQAPSNTEEQHSGPTDHEGEE